MNVAAFLQAHGFVPKAPSLMRGMGTAHTVVASHVPMAPQVPAENNVRVVQPKKLRARLLALAEGCGMDLALVHRLDGTDVAACAGLDDAQLVSYLDMLDDTATRQAGKVPSGHTAAIHCHHCGPVFVHPSIAACLPVVNGWPQAVGCAWCLIRKAGGYIPRPKVQCSECAHFHADAINPAAGIGRCASGHGAYYPMQLHGCAAFERVGNPTLTEKGTHA